jgi:hypothetical protein
MTATLERVSALLHEVGETHHRVYRIVDGADDDWASWYADWLINLSELPSLERPSEPWESYYARRVVDHFKPAAPQ